MNELKTLDNVSVTNVPICTMIFLRLILLICNNYVFLSCFCRLSIL